MGNVLDRMAAQNETPQPVAQPSVGIPQPIVSPATDQNGATPALSLHGVTPEQAAAATQPTTTSAGNILDKMAHDASVAETSDTRSPQHGAGGSWEAAPTKVGEMPRASEVWHGIADPLIPQGHVNKALHEYADSGPTKFSVEFPHTAAAMKFGAGSAGDALEFARGLTSPLMLATFELGSLAKVPGVSPTVVRIANVISKYSGRGFGANALIEGGYKAPVTGARAVNQLLGSPLNMEGVSPQEASNDLQAGAFVGLSGVAEAEHLAETPTPKGVTLPGKRTTLRPTTETGAGVATPIAASAQANPNFLTRLAAKTATPGEAARFQKEETRPAAVRRTISALSQRATDKIAAHDALANHEPAPEEITGTQIPGDHTHPDEMWKGMQDTADQTWDKAREASARETEVWNRQKVAAETSYRESVDHYNELVDQHNADPANNENDPIERQVFDPKDADVPERPKTYDELKAELDAAKDRLSGHNPSDVREKAKVEVPKAQKALDSWFKDHEDSVSNAEYQSATKLWADSMRFREIADNVRGKLAKGTLTGNDIRGLEAVIDGKAVRRRGRAGIGEFRRLMGPEAIQNLSDVARVFDPIEPSNPKASFLGSMGTHITSVAVSAVLYPMVGAEALVGFGAVEASKMLYDHFMNKVMFDPEFGSTFTKLADATKSALDSGTQVPVWLAEKFTGMMRGLAEQIKSGGESGAVGGRVPRRRSGAGAGSKPLNPEVSNNGSGDSAASQEAINREESLKSKGVSRVIVDTRSGVERPLFGVEAVDHKPAPYESIEYRGGDRDGEVIDQGRSARPYTRKQPTPAEHIASAGLVNKGGMGEGDEAISQFEHPEYPGWTAAMRNGDMTSPDAVKTHMQNKIDAFLKAGTQPQPKARNEVARVADAYNASQERPALNTKQQELDSRRTAIADAMEEMKHNPSAPKVKGAYQALINESKAQMKFLESRGYKFDQSAEDPYKSYEEMRDDVLKNKHLSVWTGGNPFPADHPLGKIDKETGWRKNDIMRGVHDIMGHIAGDNDFSEKGEENAYNLHRQAFSEDALPALTSETKGQTSWFFNNKDVRAGEAPGKFPAQKAGILPEHLYGRDVARNIASLTNQNGGATYNPAKGDMGGTDAYAVPMFKDLSRTVEGDKVTSDQIQKYMAIPAVSQALKADPRLSIGTWANGGKVYFDLSAAIPDRTEAIRVGRENGQKAITYLKNFEDINLGGAGTGTALAKDFSASEITTRRPTSVSGNLDNNPNQHANMEAIEQADRNNPSGETALGKKKMGYKEKMARTVADYAGMKFTPEELANPDRVLSKFVNHISNNLEWLYNQVPEELRGKTRQWYDAAHQIVKAKASQYGFTPEQGAGVTAALSPQNPWDNNIGLANRMMDIYKNRQNFPFSPEMEKMAADLKKVPTQSKAFRGMLRDIAGKKLQDIKNVNPNVQAMQKGLWIRLYDEAHGSPINDQYSPTGEVVGHSPDTKSWIGLDHTMKAVKIMEDGSVSNINSVMGQGHKIRNFYNNIINPNSKAGHVTIDTHATAAAQLQPFGSKDTETAHTFGNTTVGTPGPPKDASTGLQGTYPLYAEAYQRVAKKLGIQPRELQSVTWEASKALFDNKTPELKAQVKDIWNQVADGTLKPDAAREQIKAASNGFSKPAWMSDEEWEKTGAESEDTSFMGQGEPTDLASQAEQLDPMEAARRASIRRAKQQTKLARRGVSGGSDADAAPFYSKAAQVINQKIANNATPDQVRATLKNNGVKDNELQWMGLDTFLKDKPKVSKAELEKFVQENQIQLTDATYGDDQQDKITDLNAKRAKAYAENNRIGQNELSPLAAQHDVNLGPVWRAAQELNISSALMSTTAGGMPETFIPEEIDNFAKTMPEPLQDVVRRFLKSNVELDSLDAQLKELDGKRGDVRAPKYTSWQLDGPKQNEREVLMQIKPPVEQVNAAETIDTKSEKMFGKPFYQLLRHQAQEVWDSLESEGKGLNPTELFKYTQHWDEPNVVAHVRMNDRTSVDGKKTLFMEEAQSDWAQQGHAKGWKGEPETTPAQPAGTKFEMEQNPDGRGYTIHDEHGRTWWAGTDEATAQTRLADFNARGIPAQPAKTRTGNISNMPFKNNWHELAMKKMLRLAAEKGYDQLAWTTGTQQAERNSLAKHVSRLQYNPFSNYLMAYDPNGRQVLNETVVPEKLPDYIGKDVARQLLETKPNGSNHELATKDLKIGGEFHKQLYDQKIPQFLAKYAKKWDAHVGTTQLDVDTREGLHYEVLDPRGEIYDAFRSREAADKAAKELTEAKGIKAPSGSTVWTVRSKAPKPETVHSIEITPAMKKSVMKEGQPIAKADLPDREISA